MTQELTAGPPQHALQVVDTICLGPGSFKQLQFSAVILFPVHHTNSEIPYFPTGEESS